MIIFTALVGLAPQVEPTPTIIPEAQILSVVSTSTPEWIKQRISHYAEVYGVSEITMNHIVKCESNYVPNIWGDYGNSRGLVQIHYPSNPTISDEQAMDIEFALDFLARNLKNGKGSMWTCWHTR